MHQVDPAGLSLEEEQADPLLPSSSRSALALSPDYRQGYESWRSWRSWYIFGLVVADLLAALLALAFCFAVRPQAERFGLQVLGWRIDYEMLGLLAVICWLAGLAAAGSYRSHYPAEGFSDYRIPVVTAFRLMAIVAIASFALEASLSRLLVVAFFPALVFSCLLTRWVLRQVLTRMRRKGLALNRLILAGDEASVTRFAEHLGREPSHGYRVIAVCLPGASGGRKKLDTEVGSYAVAGSLSMAVSAAERFGADSLAVVGTPRFETGSLQEVAWRLESREIDLLVAPDVIDLAGPRIRVTPVTGMPLLHITEPRIAGCSRWLKPCYEWALSVPLLLMAAPVFLVVSFAILLDSGGPIFYRQKRIGYGGKEFEMLKFRSMVREADKSLIDLREANEHDGPLFKIRNDPRVTRVGRFIRKYSIDELPQLINVLKGDMVLVGPRPCLQEETEAFGEAARRRFLARPGLTGLWQVSGRSDISWREAVRLDLYYVENWSPVLDLMILYRTVRVVVGGHSGY